MADTGFKRKLAAILSADVEGYSRLMGDDEEATVRTLTSYREVLTTIIQQHNGNVLDFPGDNLLAEFVSVVDSVQCAVAVQKEIKARNDELPESRRMQFRIGINLGDVIQEEERIYGDGVNIAARLEGLSEPGGICISKTVFDHIESKLPYGYEFLGDQTVKNIAKPVGTYRVLMKPRETVAGETEKDKPPMLKRMPILIGSVTLLVLVFAVGIWQYYIRRPIIEPAYLDRMAFPLPKKPSIAVLPFAYLSDDPAQEYLADGISENIITILSTFPEIFVIDWYSIFSYKEKSVKIKQIAEEVGVQYIVEGSFQKTDEQIRVTTRLLDALTGISLWAKRYDKSLDNILEIQDEIAFHVLKSLHVKLLHGVDAEYFTGTKSMEALDYFKKAQYHRFHETCKDYDKAIGLYKKALELDPDYAASWAGLGWAYHRDYQRPCGLNPSSAELRIDCAMKALSINQSTPEAHTLLSKIYWRNKEYDKGIHQLENALTSNPNSAELHLELGNVLQYAGRQEEAIPFVEKAIRLNPFHPWYYLLVLSKCYFGLQEYNKALQIAEKLLIRGQKEGHRRAIISAHEMIAINFVGLGQIEQAQAHMKKFLEFKPNVTVYGRGGYMRPDYPNEADLERILDALRKAGMPG